MKSLGTFPDPFIAEISGQPGALRRAAAAIAEQPSTLAEAVELASGRTLVFTGMGSSYDACYPAVTELANVSIPALQLDAAELLHFRGGLLGPGTLLIAVSQSGESAETVRVAQLAREAGAPVVAVTNGTGSALANLAGAALDTRAGTETGPSSMTFAASLVAVGAIGRSFAGVASDEVARSAATAAEAAAASLEVLLSDETLADRLAAWHGGRGTTVILGRGPARAAAEMGSLTIKEAVGMMIESLQTAQFRHGPLELAGPDLAAIVLATEPETRDLDVGLARELTGLGAAVLLVTQEPAVVDGVLSVVTGTLDRTVCPAVAILPAQLLAWKLAIARGREPGAYYRASKVTTHE